MVDKNIINYFIDSGMVISFTVCFITGIMKWPGRMEDKGLPMDILKTVHDWSGLIMGLLVLAHLILHWRWIVAMTKKYVLKSGKP
jgi:hypothetical protein